MTLGIARTVIICAAALASTGFAYAAETKVEVGKNLAERLCARCHAVGQKGDSPMKEAPLFRGFAKKWPLENLAEALAEGITVGHDVMPAFELTPDQIDVFLSYLKTLKAD